MRLFVAIVPDAACAEELLCLARGLAARTPVPPWRETPTAQVHLTLQFIGDRRPSELEDTIESIARSTAGLAGFTLTPRQLTTLPPHPPTRMLTVRTDAPGDMRELQRRLSTRLAKATRRGPTTRDAAEGFTPHITLCRFPTESASFVIDQQIEGTPIEVREIVLMDSVMHPGGSVHRVIERFEFRGR